MLPDWMNHTEDYTPPRDGNAFMLRTIRTLGGAMSRIQIQAGQESGRKNHALLRLILLILCILMISVTQNATVLTIVTAVLLVRLCLLEPENLWNILKPGLLAAGLALLLFLPAMLLRPDGLMTNLTVILKVWLCVCLLSIYNHTTQWNHITGALRRLHIPGIFIFTIDITLKYIVLLGKHISDLLTAMLLRAVGRNRKKYNSIGGVLGVTFLRGSELNRQMYEAMRCRGFTDDYEGMK